MKKMQMQVSEDLSIMIMPDNTHEFLIATKDVASGYGVSGNSIRSIQSRYFQELKEGKHFVKGVANCNTLANIQPHQVFWTKQGVVRLGFYVKSERAKLFRDWVENLVVDVMSQKLPKLPETPKRKHNRLTPERLLDIMNDVCQIKDDGLRTKLAQKILGIG